MVSVQGISKSYQRGKEDIPALDKITFEVKTGELFGLIGPDGAGKTTLFRILTTLLLPDEGTASVGGYDVVKDFKHIRREVGYMPGRFSLYQDLSVEENLHFFATLFNTTIEQNYELIKDIYVQIEPFKKRRAGKLSGGMKQKLALCCALIHKPKVLFLDEPTTGVDTVSRKEFWDMLKRLKEKNITILVSTPYMDEATLCDRIALIQKGQVFSVDTPSHVIAQYPHPLFAVRGMEMAKLLRDLRAMPTVMQCNAFGESHHVQLADVSNGALEDLRKSLVEMGHRDILIERIEPTIEDCFIQFMNEYAT